MSHRHAKWMREAEAQRPLWKLTCQHPGCDFVRLTTDPEFMKVVHQGERHFGHPMQFGVVKWKEGSNANG